MKAVLFLSVLAVLSTNLDASVARAPATRANLNVGYPGTADRLLHRSYVQRYAIANAVQYQDLIYRGNATTRISSIQATEVGYTQYANAWILSGGLRANNVTIRVQSARGLGFYYQISIWGH